MAKTRLVTVNSLDYIIPFGVFGPIVKPTSFLEGAVINAVMRGYKVMEVSTDPRTKGKKVLLTVKNFNDPKRFDEVAAPEKVDKSAITGTYATGKASVVNALAPDAPVDVPTTESAEPVTLPENPTANPINTTHMSKAERKKAAKEARKAEEEAKAAAAANADTEEKVDVSLPESTETTESAGPESLKTSE